MLPFQKTTIYCNAVQILQQLLKDHTTHTSPQLKAQLEQEAYKVTTSMAKAFHTEDEDLQKKYFHESIEGIVSILALMDLADKKNKTAQTTKALAQLRTLKNRISHFKQHQKKILILSAKLGHGHMSASHAIAQALQEQYGYDYHVEIVDFIEILSSTINLVTKTYYENSVKFAPSMYRFIYESSNKNKQLMKLINTMNYPFVLTKIRKFFEEKAPDILISTFPVWNYLAADIWKKYNKDAKFISVVTDSISIHGSWTLADTDYYVVANDDTKEVIEQMGGKPSSIKVLGFPVKNAFQKQTNKAKFFKKYRLNPKLPTYLFLPTSQSPKHNQKLLEQILSLDEKMNLVVITGRDSKNKPKFEKMTEDMPYVKIIGWTDHMPDFIKTADIVITKAGGATVMECIAAEKPMIITSVIPGQEEGNAELIKRYNLGIIAGKRENIAKHIRDMQSNMSTYQKNLKKVSNPAAATKIAEFIHGLLE